MTGRTIVIGALNTDAIRILVWGCAETLSQVKVWINFRLIHCDHTTEPRACKMIARPAQMIGDVAFEHGVRFHIAPSGKLKKGMVLVLWDAPSDDPVGIILRTDEPWPTLITIDEITAAFVGSAGDVADAVAFIGANKTGILH